MSVRKRKILVFGTVWVVLFAGTFVVHRSWGSASANADSANVDTASGEGANANVDADNDYAALVRKATRIRLDGIARRSWNSSLVTLDAESNQQLTESFLDRVRTLNDAIFSCLSDTVLKSPLRTNYYELSFDVRPSDSHASGSQPTVTLSDVIIERSTIEFTRPERECLMRTLGGLQVQSDRSEPTRFAHVLCISNR